VSEHTSPSPGPEHAIEVRDLTRRFGAVEALRGISFSVRPGEFVGLIGHNGAGKTTALRILTGQLPPTSGQVRVAGLDVQAEPQRARAAMGYTPEHPELYDYLTARELLEFVAQVRGGGSLDDALALAGLGDDADRLIREYSQGMRRRTALAAAVLAKPPVLIFDEALNGLDPPSAARVKEHLSGLCRQGHAVLLSTHVLETVERIADRVLMLAHGRIVADERVEDIGQAGLERLFLERIQQSHEQVADGPDEPPTAP
jgi:ABC-2 type transport system ATP-binding protein